MFKVFVNYSNLNLKIEVARRTTAIQAGTVPSVLNGPEFLEIQRTVREVPVSDPGHSLRPCRS